MIPIFNNQPWVADAICAGTDVEAFFPEKSGSSREAKIVCAACPVSSLCLNWAMETGERHGIYGGYTPKERKKYKRSGYLRPLPEPVERTRKRCGWCRTWFTGEQTYCCTDCSSAGTRHERLERLAEIRDAS